MEIENKVIDYLIEHSGCDLCGKCAYYVQPKENEDFKGCQMFDRDGNGACRQGMIEWFKSSRKTKVETTKSLNDLIYEIKKFGIQKVVDLTGISRSTITKWCSREIIPTITNAEKVANVMGLEFLLFEKE